jgi:hypothetical protein
VGIAGRAWHPRRVDPENIFALPELAIDEIARLRAHVVKIAAEHGVRWREVEMSFLEAEGDIGEDWVVSPTIGNELHYLVVE